MNFDKLFNEGTKKNKRIMTVILLLLGILITVWGLWRGLNDLDPKYFVLVASLVGLLISGFAISGKLFQDIKGSKKQQDILDTTIATLNTTRQALETATNNFALSQKIDTITSYTNELSKLTITNISLLKTQNDKIVELNEEIDKNLTLVKVINETQTKQLEELNGNVTGGDSYFSLFMFPQGNQLRLSGVIGGELEGSIGKYPIDNLSLTTWRNGELISVIEPQNYNSDQDYSLGNYYLPINENFVTFSFRIFSKNRNYNQYIIFKKYTNNKWYYHLVQLYDIYGFKLRANTYEGSYPEELKQMYKQADMDILQIIDKINRK